jgi:L-histidine N-alpha-methyltransferase
VEQRENKMSASFKILSQKDLDEIAADKKTFARDVLIGLSEVRKRLPTKYHYDDEGSRLFQKIMTLPEYYPTNHEFEILETERKEIAKLMEKHSFNLVELGAGDGVKTSILLQEFLEQEFEFQYVPIDISEGAMHGLVNSIQKKFPNLKTNGIVAEYFDGVKWLSRIGHQKNLVLFLGSNLGNFSATQSKIFLRTLWNTLDNDDFVLIGFDLKKDIDKMLDAYNDSQGVTAEFNLNMLRRINYELGGNFDLSKFRHYATYDVFSGAIESYLVSLEQQTVFIEELSETFDFMPWEPIHTEYSYKYLVSDVEKLARDTGYTIEKHLFDSKRYFMDSIWRVQKTESI